MNPRAAGKKGTLTASLLPSRRELQIWQLWRIPRAHHQPATQARCTRYPHTRSWWGIPPRTWRPLLARPRNRHRLHNRSMDRSRSGLLPIQIVRTHHRLPFRARSTSVSLRSNIRYDNTLKHPTPSWFPCWGFPSSTSKA